MVQIYQSWLFHRVFLYTNEKLPFLIHSSWSWLNCRPSFSINFTANLPMGLVDSKCSFSKDFLHTKANRREYDLNLRFPLFPIRNREWLQVFSFLGNYLYRRFSYGNQWQFWIMSLLKKFPLPFEIKGLSDTNIFFSLEWKIRNSKIL